MEIISYVLEGALAHNDSTGNGGVIRPGDVQRMSAGRGVTHSEMNPEKAPVHFLQIWLMPTERGLPPGYDQKSFPESEKRGKLRVVASPDGRDGSIVIHADAVLHAGLFDAGETTELELATDRHAWIHVARGVVRVNGQELVEGDGAALSSEARVAIEGVADAEVLVFDLG